MKSPLFQKAHIRGSGTIDNNLLLIRRWTARTFVCFSGSTMALGAGLWGEGMSLDHLDSKKPLERPQRLIWPRSPLVPCSPHCVRLLHL